MERVFRQQQQDLQIQQESRRKEHEAELLRQECEIKELERQRRDKEEELERQRRAKEEEIERQRRAIEEELKRQRRAQEEKFRRKEKLKEEKLKIEAEKRKIEAMERLRQEKLELENLQRQRQRALEELAVRFEQKQMDIRAEIEETKSRRGDSDKTSTHSKACIKPFIPPTFKSGNYPIETSQTDTGVTW